MTSESAVFRRRAILLQYGVIAYNLLEMTGALVIGLMAGSVALVGFGLDGALEISASAAVLLQLKRRDVDQAAAWESKAALFIGISLLVFAFLVWNDAILKIATLDKPDETYFGIGVAIASLLIMPRVAKMERHLALKLKNQALEAESRGTQVCAWLSATLLAGLAANALLGWWWADPAVALAMAGFIAREGIEAISHRTLVWD